MKTKFKVGDTVYCITQLNWFLQQWFVLAKAEIKKIIFGDGKIRYGFIDTCGFYIWFAEQNCFLTQEEAFAECKKRNIKLKNERKSFTEKIKRLATMLRKKVDVIVEFDSKEEENRSEIEEQIRYEAKGRSCEIRWTKGVR